MADEARIRHLLRRTEYVDKQARVDTLKLLPTMDLVVEDVLGNPGPVAIDPSIMAWDNDWERYVAAIRWWFDRMAFDSPRPLHERMAFFWHGHFTSEYQKVGIMRWMLEQNQLFRDNCLGDFKWLTQKMSVQPAMLLYLDNHDNSKWSPNQNFARELMELFTLGVGNYSEADVIAAARAWTGHTIQWNATWNDGTYRFDSSDHDANAKTFFYETKNFDGPDIIEKIFSYKGDVVAKFIVRKLWAYFASPVGALPAELDVIASEFQHGVGVVPPWNVRNVLRRIFLLEEFYSTATMQSLVRSPVDYIVAVMILTGLTAEDLHPEWYVDSMGQVPFNPPNVSGWKANATWINSASIGARAEFGMNVVYHLRSDEYAAAHNVNWDQRLRRNGSTNVQPSQAATEIARFFQLDMSNRTRAAIENYITAERTAPDRNSWWEVTNVLQMGILAPELQVF